MLATTCEPRKKEGMAQHKGGHATHHHQERKGLNMALKDIFSGTMGGIAQVLAGHPLDTGILQIYLHVTIPYLIVTCSQGAASNSDGSAWTRTRISRHD